MINENEDALVEEVNEQTPDTDGAEESEPISKQSDPTSETGEAEQAAAKEALLLFGVTDEE